MARPQAWLRCWQGCAETHPMKLMGDSQAMKHRITADMISRIGHSWASYRATRPAARVGWKSAEHMRWPTLARAESRFCVSLDQDSAMHRTGQDPGAALQMRPGPAAGWAGQRLSAKAIGGRDWPYRQRQLLLVRGQASWLLDSLAIPLKTAALIPAARASFASLHRIHCLRILSKRIAAISILSAQARRFFAADALQGTAGEAAFPASDWFSPNGHRPMTGINHWSITLNSRRSRRPRWFTVNGDLSSNPAQALRLVCPEVAAQRVQNYLRLWGRPIELIERFQLVPSPPVPAAVSLREQHPGRTARLSMLSEPA